MNPRTCSALSRTGPPALMDSRPSSQAGPGLARLDFQLVMRSSSCGGYLPIPLPRGAPKHVPLVECREASWPGRQGTVRPGCPYQDRSSRTFLPGSRRRPFVPDALTRISLALYGAQAVRPGSTYEHPTYFAKGVLCEALPRCWAADLAPSGSQTLRSPRNHEGHFSPVYRVGFAKPLGKLPFLDTLEIDHK